MEISPCDSLEEVRAEIDRLGRTIVALVVERGFYVRQAAHFKKTVDDVQAPQRVEQVISRVRVMAKECGGHAGIVERVYRAMTAAFIEAEVAEHRSLHRD